MSDLILETNLQKPSAQASTEIDDSPCFDCGNCCRNIYGELPIKDIVYLISRGYQPIICQTDYQFGSIKKDSESYPSNLYLYSESFGKELELVIDTAKKAEAELLDKIETLPIEFAIIGECINHDPTTNMCADYENRPDLCRLFNLGGKGCQNIRSKYNLPEIPLTQIADVHMIIK